MYTKNVQHFNTICSVFVYIVEHLFDKSTSAIVFMIYYTTKVI